MSEVTFRYKCRTELNGKEVFLRCVLPQQLAPGVLGRIVAPIDVLHDMWSQQRLGSFDFVGVGTYGLSLVGPRSYGPVGQIIIREQIHEAVNSVMPSLDPVRPDVNAAGRERGVEGRRFFSRPQAMRVSAAAIAVLLLMQIAWLMSKVSELSLEIDRLEYAIHADRPDGLRASCLFSSGGCI